MQTSPEPRGARWASTMAGFGAGHAPEAAPPPGLRFAHADSWARHLAMAADGAGVGHVPPPPPSAPRTWAGVTREVREMAEAASLAPGATRAVGAGRRHRPEPPDPWRTCFERDRDRILHSTAFRRLAGKTQVFIFPEDHQRSRLTHALEVAQVATSISRACGLNVALTEAIALGHDCGHGPGGHASEDALAPYLPEGFDHAPWGAAVSLAPRNLCLATLDGIANHSWSRPAPATPEGEVVSWADRVAYVCHDWEDAVADGVVAPGQLPAVLRRRCGATRSQQLGAFIQALVETTLHHGVIGMPDEMADALAAFRACNYERIYLREASRAQGQAVVAVLRALVEHYADRPNVIPAVQEAGGLAAGSEEALRAAVTYVAGMTDRYAFRQALSQLGWDPAKLPRGIGQEP